MSRHLAKLKYADRSSVGGVRRASRRATDFVANTKKIATQMHVLPVALVCMVIAALASWMITLLRTRVFKRLPRSVDWKSANDNLFHSNINTIGIRLPQFASSRSSNMRTHNTSVVFFQGNLIFASRVSNLYESGPSLVSEIIIWMSTNEGIGQCRVVAEDPKDVNRRILGYEDPRIFIDQGTLSLIVTSYLARPLGSTPYPFIISLDVEKVIREISLSSKRGDIRNIVPEKIDGPFFFKCIDCAEKNWSPLVHQDVVYFIQSIQPLVMLTLRKGVMTVVPTEENAQIPNALKNFHLRGGSCAFLWRKDRYLLVGHVVREENNSNSYSSFFYEMSANPFRITRYSNPFKLEDARIEFLTGLVAFESEVWLTGGVQDHDSVLWKLSGDHVDSLMNAATVS